MSARLFFLRIAGGTFLLALLLTACDAAPGPQEPASPPAFVPGSFELAPDTVDLRGRNIPSRGDTLVPIGIPIQVSVAARNPERMDSVKYVVQGPLTGLPALGEGELHQQSGNRFAAADTVTMIASLPGLYTVLVYGKGAQNQRSQQEFRGVVRLIGGGDPPEVEAVQAPDAVQRPAEETERVTVSADVSDPEGLLNISRVVLLAPDGEEFAMFDDGGQGSPPTSGDQEAGDGRYTIRYPVEPDALTGAKTFTVRAVDRTGQEAESQFSITITS